MTLGVIVLLNLKSDGSTDELSREIQSFDDLPEVLAEMDEEFPGWKAITIVHIEDMPRMMQGVNPL